jgi:hypothetical protein
MRVARGSIFLRTPFIVLAMCVCVEGGGGTPRVPYRTVNFLILPDHRPYLTLCGVFAAGFGSKIPNFAIQAFLCHRNV